MRILIWIALGLACYIFAWLPLRISEGLAIGRGFKFSHFRFERRTRFLRHLLIMLVGGYCTNRFGFFSYEGGAFLLGLGILGPLLSAALLPRTSDSAPGAELEDLL